MKRPSKKYKTHNHRRRISVVRQIDHNSAILSPGGLISSTATQNFPISVSFATFGLILLFSLDLGDLSLLRCQCELASLSSECSDLEIG